MKIPLTEISYSFSATQAPYRPSKSQNGMGRSFNAAYALSASKDIGNSRQYFAYAA
jgi:hypothetical protein